MSNPSIPETIMCGQCYHPYAMDLLSEAQRAQDIICPWCNPMSEEEETEWKILEGFNAMRGAA